MNEAESGAEQLIVLLLRPAGIVTVTNRHDQAMLTQLLLLINFSLRLVEQTT